MATNRITRSFLQARVDRLNKVLNRPATAWTRLPADTKFKPLVMRANVGHFQLDSNSPGDGWTRYTLSLIVSEGGGETNCSRCLTASEMSAYLQGVFDVLDSEYTRNFDKLTEPSVDKIPVS
jgi:hypothetical protein